MCVRRRALQNFGSTRLLPLLFSAKPSNLTGLAHVCCGLSQANLIKFLFRFKKTKTLPEITESVFKFYQLPKQTVNFLSVTTTMSATVTTAMASTMTTSAVSAAMTTETSGMTTTVKRTVTS